MTVMKILKAEVGGKSYQFSATEQIQTCGSCTKAVLHFKVWTCNPTKAMPDSEKIIEVADRHNSDQMEKALQVLASHGASFLGASPAERDYLMYESKWEDSGD